MKQVLRALDAFPRAEEHLLQKTKSGAFGIIISDSMYWYLGWMIMNHDTTHLIGQRKSGLIVTKEAVIANPACSDNSLLTVN